MQFSEQDHGVPRVGETATERRAFSLRSSISSSRLSCSFPFPPFRYDIYGTPLNATPFQGKTKFWHAECVCRTSFLHFFERMCRHALLFPSLLHDDLLEKGIFLHFSCRISIATCG